MPDKRKRNTPKKYPNKGTGVGKNPRVVCDQCGKYMKKAKAQFAMENKKLKTLTPLAFCKFCKNVKWYDEELKKIPD